jgi:hypothetical protein
LRRESVEERKGKEGVSEEIRVSIEKATAAAATAAQERASLCFERASRESSGITSLSAMTTGSACLKPSRR